MAGIKISLLGPPPRKTHQNGLMTASVKGFSRIYMRADVKIIFDGLTKRIKEQFGTRKPLEGPLSADILWIWPYRQTDKKDLKDRKVNIPCDKRPDQDNLQKGLWDCITKAGVLKDDSQVFDCRFRKYYGAEPGIYITLKNNVL